MASSGFGDENSQLESTFPAADVEAELHPSKTHEFPLDPVSSDVAEAKDLEKEAEAKIEDEMKTWKTAVVISGVVVAVIAAVFVVSKKLKSREA